MVPTIVCDLVKCGKTGEEMEKKKEKIREKRGKIREKEREDKEG